MGRVGVPPAEQHRLTGLDSLADRHDARVDIEPDEIPDQIVAGS